MLSNCLLHEVSTIRNSRSGSNTWRWASERCSSQFSSRDGFVGSLFPRRVPAPTVTFVSADHFLLLPPVLDAYCHIQCLVAGPMASNCYQLLSMYWLTATHG